MLGVEGDAVDVGVGDVDRSTQSKMWSEALGLALSADGDASDVEL